MNNPAPKTNPEAALGNLMGAALGTPETSHAAPNRPEMRNLPWRILRHVVEHALPVLLGRKAKGGISRAAPTPFWLPAIDYPTMPSRKPRPHIWISR